jgi:hypothetical protein
MTTIVRHLTLALTVLLTAVGGGCSSDDSSPNAESKATQLDPL